MSDDQDIWRHLRSRLVARRCQLGISLAELDRKIGVADGLVAKWECGDRQPSVAFLALWCQVLNMHIETKTGRAPDPVPIPPRPKTWRGAWSLDERTKLACDALEMLLASKIIRITSENLTLMVKKTGRDLSARQIAKILRPLGIRPRLMWFDGQPRRGYLRASFLTLVNRLKPNENNDPNGSSKARVLTGRTQSALTKARNTPHTTRAASPRRVLANG